MNDHADLIKERTLAAEQSMAFAARERRAMTRHSRFQFFHWLVLLASIALTTTVWYFIWLQEQQSIQARFDLEANHTTDLIVERLQKYELALWGGVSAIKTKGDQMRRAEWKEFADSLRIKDRYPGINGIGVIHEVEPDELEAYLARERIDLPDYNIHPPHDQDIYRPITFIEPIGINAEAVGLDMVHEANRNTGLLQARDSGEAVITGPIVLVQDHDETPGFLFYAPLYAGHDTQTVQARQDAFLGAVYAPFIVGKLIEGSLSKDRRYTTLRISDGDQVIFDETDPDSPDFDPDPLAQKHIDLSVYGRIWNVDIRTDQKFREANVSRRSNLVLFFGILLHLILFALFLMLTRAHQRGVNFAELATKALDHEATALRAANSALDEARKDAEGLSQMKSNFLATMSHEVRTPLTAMSGILVLLERTNPNPENSKLIQAARASSDKLMKLLTSVLDMSRLEANAVKLWERPVRLAPLLGDWRTIAEGIVESLGKNIDVRTEIADDVPETLVVDDVRLSQIIGNLIDNAARFTRKGHIKIAVSHQPGQGSGAGDVVFSLADTGAGIAKEDQDRIFDRFRQVDGSITRANQGTGLGLAICQDLVKLMGGTITLTSVLGQGATFDVALPIKPIPVDG